MNLDQLSARVSNDERYPVTYKLMHDMYDRRDDSKPLSAKVSKNYSHVCSLFLAGINLASILELAARETQAALNVTGLIT